MPRHSPRALRPPAAAHRPPFPLLAATVPVVAAGVLWLVTGSTGVLWLAVLGPLMAVAAALDARRAGRAQRRRAAAERTAATVDAQSRLEQAHARERAELWARHPDAAAFAAAPAEIWRAVPGRAGVLVIGRGAVPSTARVNVRAPDAIGSGDGVVTLLDAPVVVPAAAGIAVAGPPVLVAAVVRGLVLQLLCQHPPDALVLAEPCPDWAEKAPHRGHGAIRLLVERPPEPGTFAILAVAPGTPPPPACHALLTLGADGSGLLDHDGRLVAVEVEAVGAAQAAALASRLQERAVADQSATPLPDELDLAELLRRMPEPGEAGLASPLGAAVEWPLLLDLVADGPHAVVAGMTGGGKSELLTTWVVGMAARHGPERVVFLLVDFKGGTAFRRLESLPHVTGVITDLDPSGARRAIASLGAEIRRREQQLASAGARTVEGVGLPRLVIVVDEFAALLAQAPELAAVFTDVAARGRALGLHLVLGTQRAAGVMREALLANCPLRVSLPVADAADSRFLLDTADAAQERTPGIAHVRTATGPRAVRVRVALCDDDLIATVVARTPAVASRATWLPELPDRLPLTALAHGVEGAGPAGILLALADEPEHQRQRPVALGASDTGLAVLGGASSGRSALLAAVAAQDHTAVLMPCEPEAAWDLVAHLDEHPPPAGTALIIDDLDLLLTRFPPDVGSAFGERLALVSRGAGLRPVVSAGRFAGPAARIAELCSRRLLLRMPTRLDHIAAGGEAAVYDPNAPRGRGVLDGATVQAVDAVPVRPAPVGSPPPWRPSSAPTAIVVAGAAACRRVAEALSREGIPMSSPGDDDPRSHVVVGDADRWQRAWRQLTDIRAAGDLVVDAACLAEYRVLTGERTTPLYCEPGRGRAWLIADGDPVRRVLLPGLSARARG